MRIEAYEQALTAKMWADNDSGCHAERESKERGAVEKQLEVVSDMRRISIVKWISGNMCTSWELRGRRQRYGRMLLRTLNILVYIRS